MDLKSTIHLAAPKSSKFSTINPKKPLNLTYKRTSSSFFLLVFVSLLESGYHKEKERLKPKLGVV